MPISIPASFIDLYFKIITKLDPTVKLISRFIGRFPQITMFFVTAVICVFVTWICLRKIKREQIAWSNIDFESGKYLDLNDSQKRFARRNSWHYGFFNKL